MPEKIQNEESAAMAGFWNKMKKVQDTTRPFCSAIVPAAGSSRRMGGENKLLLPVGGAPVLLRTLQAIDQTELVDEIIVATRHESLMEVADLCQQANLRKRVRVVEGGQSRTESVLAAALEADPRSRFLAVHDGARPLVIPTEFDEVIRTAQRTNAAAPAVPVTDTIKSADASGRVTGTPDRSTLFAVQTPQVFQAELLRAALQSVLADGGEVTDDCGAVERMGKEVYLTPGNRENIKITTPIDVVIAEAILARREKNG